jgi:hypothetical protein
VSGEDQKRCSESYLCFLHILWFYSLRERHIPLGKCKLSIISTSEARTSVFNYNVTQTKQDRQAPLIVEFSSGHD